jgi:hypothetical protein
MVRGIFRSKRVEGVGGWRRQHKEELYNPNASPNISRVKESRRL